MAIPSFDFYIIIFLGALGTVKSCTSTHAQPALFTFGDSLYDPGNNNYINTTTDFQANFRPYGESFSNYPTGRFCDGRLIPDFIAEHAKLPLIPAFLKPGDHQFEYGANFASGGAGALAETHQGLVIDLKTQLGYFKKVVKVLSQILGDKDAKQLLSNSVYMINIGGNDYLSPLATNHLYSQGDFVEMVLGNLTDVIKEIYVKGGRKFGFVSMVPLGCLPNKRILNPKDGGGDCKEELNTLAKVHNKALSKTIHKLQRQLEGFMYSKFQLYTSFLERIDHPSKYGFKDGKRACCGSGPLGEVYSCGGKRGIKEYELCGNASEFVFFDSYHSSQMAYRQLAELMWNGPPNLTGPHNLKSLFERTI